MTTYTIIVVPCYNEAKRFQENAFISFCERNPSIGFIFVNDGSTDSTLDIISGLMKKDPDRFMVVDKSPNQGKAEAVRVGMVSAFKHQPTYAGYWDADLATPLDQIRDFVQVLENKPEIEVVFGARVQLLGRSIIRSPYRHYLGRVFATVASLVLQLPVYDTQCGAKLFRVSPNIESLFFEPFCTGWIFDVEVIARLIQTRRDGLLPAPSKVIYEFPLYKWRDVAGSKVKPGDFIKGVFEMNRIHKRYLKNG